MGWVVWVVWVACNVDVWGGLGRLGREVLKLLAGKAGLPGNFLGAFAREFKKY